MSEPTAMSSTSSVQELGAAYLAARRGELSADTVVSFSYPLKGFAKAIGNVPGGEVRRHHVEQWMAGQAGAPSGVRHRLSIVRTFCGWCVFNGYMTVDPTLGVKGPKAP